MIDWCYENISDFHNRVRAVLNDTPDTTLTNAHIDMPEKAPSAELYIKHIVRNWETLKTTGDKKFNVFESCIVYQTALLLENFVKQKQPQKIATSSINVEFSSTPNYKPEITLKDTLMNLISQLDEEETGQTSFYGFRVT